MSHDHIFLLRAAVAAKQDVISSYIRLEKSYISHNTFCQIGTRTVCFCEPCRFKIVQFPLLDKCVSLLHKLSQSFRNVMTMVKKEVVTGYATLKIKLMSHVCIVCRLLPCHVVWNVALFFNNKNKTSAVVCMKLFFEQLDLSLNSLRERDFSGRLMSLSPQWEQFSA